MMRQTKFDRFLDGVYNIFYALGIVMVVVGVAVAINELGML